MRLAPLKPLQQGGLDGLCSVYCVINAVRWIARASRPLRRADQAALFADLVPVLDRHVGLEEALVSGVDLAGMLKLCRTASRHCDTRLGLPIAIDRPFTGSPPMMDFAETLRASFKRAPTAFIIGLFGYHDHWSVCTGVTDTSLILFDSWQLRRIALKNCAVTARQNSRTSALHRIPARAIISLQAKS